MSKRLKIVLISVVAVVLALCVGTAGYIVAVNLNNAPVYLGKEITETDFNNLEKFVSETTSEYLADKTICISYGSKEISIPVTDFVAANIDNTVQHIKLDSENKRLFSLKRAEFTPEFDIASDNAGEALFTFAQANADFYTYDNDYKSVQVGLTKPIMDVDSTIIDIILNIKELDFSDKEFKLSDTKDVEYIYSLINQKPIDAELKMDGEEISITKEKVGFTIDKNQLIDAVSAGKTKFSVDITEVIMPEITEEILMDKQMFGDVLSSCSSYYNANVAGRARNVELAASKINGLVMQPGDVFSYNKVVGPRTYENGFKDAGVYTATGLESGVGGGICQVSSTLYGAQLMADLKTVSRTNHSYTIGYLPSGQDATVSYGAIDYKFENSKHFPIKIECVASGGLLRVNILGIKTDDYKEIKLYNEIVSTRDFNVVEKEVDTLQPGEQKITQSGQRGMTVNTYKIYYNNGTEEKREFVHKSTYIPMPQIVEKGKETEEEVPVDSEPVVEEVPEDKYEEPVTEANGGTQEAMIPEDTVENDTEVIINNQIIDENVENIVESEEIMIN